MNDPIDRIVAASKPSTAKITGSNLHDIGASWKPQIMLERSHKVATFGSCFAKNLGPALKEKGYTWFDSEPAPNNFVPEIRRKFNYGIFSARTGDIGTAASLKQWVSWAIDAEKPPEKLWQKGRRFFDPFRPTIEPDGFATPDELLASRRAVLHAIRTVAERADWFVFTLGQTTGWTSASKGYIYAMCPVDFDINDHSSRNYSLAEVCADLNWVIDAISTINRKTRFVLTVSASPLSAPESGNHAGAATPASQSLLCAAAMNIAENRKIVDYYPSYEIITAPLSHAMRSVPNGKTEPNPGAMFAMKYFFGRLTPSRHGASPGVEPETAVHPGHSDPNVSNEYWGRILEARNALRLRGLL